jgi:hypothetical protein
MGHSEARTGQCQLAARMRGAGIGTGVVAGELASRYGLRPRAAWRDVSAEMLAGQSGKGVALAAHHGGFMADDDTGHAIAGRIEREHPRWIVMFGNFSGQFVAFPRFDTPVPLRIENRSPRELTGQMEQAENQFLGGRRRGMKAVTMDYLRIHYGRTYEFSAQDGKCFARALFGSGDVLEADSPAELLTLVRRHYPGRNADS